MHQRDSQARQYTARGLAKWTRFNISIAVYNAVGYGPTTWPVTARTAEDGKHVFCANTFMSVEDCFFYLCPLSEKHSKYSRLNLKRSFNSFL